jgi:hypothetical protein
MTSGKNAVRGSSILLKEEVAGIEKRVLLV